MSGVGVITRGWSFRGTCVAKGRHWRGCSRIHGFLGDTRWRWLEVSASRRILDVVYDGSSSIFFLLRRRRLGTSVPWASSRTFKCIAHVLEVRERSGDTRRAVGCIRQPIVGSARSINDGVHGASVRRLVRVAWRKLRDAETLVAMRFAGHRFHSSDRCLRAEMVYLGGRQLSVVIASRMISALVGCSVTVAAMTGRERRHVGVEPRPMVLTSGPDNSRR